MERQWGSTASKPARTNPRCRSRSHALLGAISAAAAAAAEAFDSRVAARGSLTLTNRGPLAGDQVVQAYLVPLEISAPEVGARPVKSLFDFARARDVAAGGTATVAFRVDAASLKLVASNGDLVAASGRYMLRFETGDPSVEVAEAEVRLVGATKVIERFPSIK